MFRFLTYVLVMLFVITILKNVVSFILRGFSELMQSHAGSQSRPTPSQSVPLTGELKKDPVCGTYTAAASSIQQTIRGQTFYFCSPQCRDKYVASLT
jgi:YHS domain-containing protein